MIIKKLLVVIVLLVLSCCIANAQENFTHPDSSLAANRTGAEAKQGGNFLKLSITELANKNYSMQYEKLLTRKISVALSFKIAPGTTLSLKNLIVSTAGQNDPNIVRTIENLRLKHSSITPELRFYTSKKGYGRGFYVAPFYRYAGFKTTDLAVSYEDCMHKENSIKLSGKLTTHTVGVMFGAQWVVAKRVCVDWWVMGPHYGRGTGDFSGMSRSVLTEAQQESIRTELHNLDFPLSNKTINVSNCGASLRLNGLWAGLRGGICLGLKY